MAIDALVTLCAKVTPLDMLEVASEKPSDDNAVSAPAAGIEDEEFLDHETETVGLAEPLFHIWPLYTNRNAAIADPVTFWSRNVALPAEALLEPRNAMLPSPYHPPEAPDARLVPLNAPPLEPVPRKSQLVTPVAVVEPAQVPILSITCVLKLLILVVVVGAICALRLVQNELTINKITKELTILPDFRLGRRCNITLEFGRKVQLQCYPKPQEMFPKSELFVTGTII